VEDEMKRRIAAIALGASLAFAATGTAFGGSAVSTYYFYDCSGPNVPSSFWAVKTELPGAAGHPVSAASAFRVIDSTSIYTVYNFGFGNPHGIDVSGVASDWCWVTFAGIGAVQVGGQYNPGI